jgi:hypothetical protein
MPMMILSITPCYLFEMNVFLIVGGMQKYETVSIFLRQSHDNGTFDITICDIKDLL